MPSKKSAQPKRKTDELIFVTGGNAKLPPNVTTFSLLSGHTCPGAKTCLAKVKLNSEGKAYMEEGADATIRCFSAVQELAFRTTYVARKHNFDLLRACKTPEEVKHLLVTAMSQIRHLDIVRVHVGGDFFNQTYWDGWMLAMQAFPRVRFYAYTKSIPFYHDYVRRHGALPKNFRLTMSEGGKFDHLIPEGAKTAKVVLHPEEAKKAKLAIDHDDSHARSKSNKSFALLIHGQQKAGSSAQEALKRMKKEGITYGYSKQ